MPKTPTILVGFDGFIDTIIHPVRERINRTHWSRIESLEEFSERILAACGKSANIECVAITSLLGGNAPLFAQASAYLGTHIDLVATVCAHSDPSKIDQLFSPLTTLPSVTTYPIGIAGQTDAYEFHNGKLLFGKMHDVAKLTLDHFFNIISEKKLSSLIEQADAIAIVNWTMMPMVDEFWQWLAKRRSLSNKKKILFIDLTDPKKRPSADLQKAFSLLEQCIDAGFQLILSVNTSEAIQSITALGGSSSHQETIYEATKRLHTLFSKATAIFGHSHKHVIASWRDGNEQKSLEIPVPFTEKPYATTGAGDAFNGGVLSALVHGHEYKTALEWGIGASGVWVRTRRAANLEEINKFLYNHYFS